MTGLEVTGLVEQLVLAAAAEHIAQWFEFARAEHSIDHGEFAPPPVAPVSVELSMQLIDDADLWVGLDGRLYEMCDDQLLERELYREIEAEREHRLIKHYISQELEKLEILENLR